MNRPRLPAALAATLALVLGACGEASGPVASAPERPTPSTAGNSTASTPADAPSTTSPTASRPGPSTTTPPAGEGPASNSAAPNEPDAVRPGRYLYDTQGETKVESPVPRTRPLPEITTLEVSHPQERRQRFVRDLRSEDGSGTVTDTVLDLRQSGVFLVSLVMTNSGFGSDVVFEFIPENPPRVADVRASTGFRTEFTLHSTDDTVTVHVETAVVDEGSSSVGDVEVTTRTVETRTEFEGSVTGTGTSRTDIAVDHGLVVHEEETSEFTWGVSRFRTHQVSSLQSLEPA